MRDISKVRYKSSHVTENPCRKLKTNNEVCMSVCMSD